MSIYIIASQTDFVEVDREYKSCWQEATYL